MATLLDIVQAAFGELGDLDVPGTAVGNADANVTQMVALLNAAGRELVRANAWTALQALTTFTLVAGQTDYSLPADYARLIDDTEWDRSTRWPLIGPVTAQFDRFQRESILAAFGPRRDFRLVANAIRVFPTPLTSGDVLALEYVSRSWVATAGGAAAQRFTADTDACVFDFDLMVKEAKWRWRSAQKLDAQSERAERDMALSELIAADLGGGTLNMGPAGDAYGGWVVAQTDPNFALSTGSGSDIAII